MQVRLCVCVRKVHAVLAVGVFVCARVMCLGGGDFTFFRSVVYQTNLLRALAG